MEVGIESFTVSIMEEFDDTSRSRFNSYIITLADLKRFHVMLKEYYDKTNNILYHSDVYNKVTLYLDRCFLIVRHEDYKIDFKLFRDSSMCAEILHILRKCGLSEFKWDSIHKLDIVKIFKFMYDITDNALNNFSQGLDFESVVFSNLEFKSRRECLAGYRHLYDLVLRGIT